VTEPQTTNLPPEARAIIEEEHALLARVVASLQNRRAFAGRDPAELTARLKELREMAATAASFDLPTIFQEMNLVRALLEHPQDEVLPERHSPYFAHMRLEEDGKRTDYCLGRASFFDTLNGVRVVDWRFAPIARIFYRHREGDVYEEQLPGRTAEGVVEARRVVVIHRGEINRVMTPEYTLVRTDDGSWSCVSAAAGAQLRGGAGTAARAGSLGVGALTTDRSRQADVSALLDREQFEALSTSSSRPLLVLGSAGSGKTTVALPGSGTTTCIRAAGKRSDAGGGARAGARAAFVPAARSAGAGQGVGAHPRRLGPPALPLGLRPAAAPA